MTLFGNTTTPLDMLALLAVGMLSAVNAGVLAKDTAAGLATPIMCECTRNGNEMSCSNGKTRHCGTGEKCYATTPVPFG